MLLTCDLRSAPAWARYCWADGAVGAAGRCTILSVCRKVTLMSGHRVRDSVANLRLPNIATPVHLFVPAAYAFGLWLAFRGWLGNIADHRRAVRSCFVGACWSLAFLLLPSQHHWGGWLWRVTGSGLMCACASRAA
jgi:hypothetical protein